jgi:hypothetical protein
MSDQWNGNSNGALNRDQQSATFKWENLPIAPELLRSIARFGYAILVDAKCFVNP